MACEQKITRNEQGYYVGEWRGKTVRVPSVTTVLGLISDYSHVPKDVLDRACAFGNAVHSIVEMDVHGTLDVDSLKPQHAYAADLTPILMAWRDCKDAQKILTTNCEESICSLRHGYAGRFDVIGLVDGEFSLIEIKSRKYNSTLEPLQTAAYLQAWNESNPKDRIKNRYFCELSLDGTYDWREIRQERGQPDHFAIFRSALALFQWKENLSKK